MGTNWDEEFAKDRRMVGVIFAVAIVVILAGMGLGAWALIELVQWVTSK